MSAAAKTPHLPGKFIWFEHRSSDIARARAFYEPLFGWHVEAMPMGGQTYHLVLNGAAGIGGLCSGAPGERPHWISHLSVSDVDTAFRSALAAGARALKEPADYPPIGRGAEIADPTGARLSLWRSVDGDRPDPERPSAGDWCWNELWTPDSTLALAFYERVFGLSHDRMEMGEQGTYLILKGPDGKPRGGIYPSPDRSTPPMWLPYVHVDDCDASAARARELGASLCVPPTDIPNVGRFAALFDPQGAALAIIRLAAR